jgi:multiple antibiotic resistance protein
METSVSTAVFDFIKVLVLTFVTLFPVVNPIGDAPIFLSLTRRYPADSQKILARKIAAYGFVLLAMSFLFGTMILDFFGITVQIVQVAGGLVVAATGWNLLNEKDQEPKTGEAPTTLEDALEHAFFPLTLPLTVGPGCISIAITLGAHLRHQAGSSGFMHGSLRHYGAALVGMALLCVVVAICYGNADRLVKMLGKSGTSILTRLSAFILLAIGVQIMWNGMSTALTTLLTNLHPH